MQRQESECWRTQLWVHQGMADSQHQGQKNTLKTDLYTVESLVLAFPAPRQVALRPQGAHMAPLITPLSRRLVVSCHSHAHNPLPVHCP